MLRFLHEQGFRGANRGSRLCCFVSSQAVCWWSIRCFTATVKPWTAQVAFYRTAGGKDGAGGFCVASFCLHRSLVRCLASAGSLINHYINLGIVYDSTSTGNKLVGSTKTFFRCCKKTIYVIYWTQSFIFFKTNGAEKIKYFFKSSVYNLYQNKTK